MSESAFSRPRVSVDGKFFRRGAQKFHAKGLAYGPFVPNADGEPFASPDQTVRDFALAREAGANLLRVYHVPPRWLLDLAAENDLLVLVDVPWEKQRCFLDTEESRAAAREAVRRAVYACARHPAVFAYSIGNEIPSDIVRWSGERAVAEFIDELVLEAKRVDPDCLCTYTNFPPTEFLRPQRLDFVCFNVYLHQPQPFKNYLARLQMMAEARPLVLGEFGMDSRREGERKKAETLRWQIECAFRAGLAGAVVFSFTDDWFKDGRHVEDWNMGLTTADRRPKESFLAVRAKFSMAPYFPLLRSPKVSVVVAACNADRTLATCLDSLGKLNYPDYEIILVDDGSTDTTARIASEHQSRVSSLQAKDAEGGETSLDSRIQTLDDYPRVRVIRHDRNRGLSVARNTGLAVAQGEIVAFTDADCRADADWLYYLVGDLVNSEFAAMGGPNLLPPDDSAVAAAVMVSPGGPAHVMLDDRQAEHIPGCNMAFYKWALEAVGGFDPTYRKAGDDVDICWRLQQAGLKIGFSASAFVWHYRRSTVQAYVQQQRGYGEAEALLVRKHPKYFNSFGDSIWRGRIYTPSQFGVLLRAPIIYRGLFGSGHFQTLYASEPAATLMLFTALEYHVLVTLPLWVLSAAFPYFLLLAAASLLASVGVCAAAGAQARLPKGKRRWWSRPLVALLFLLQPIVRGWERYRGRLQLRLPAEPAMENLDSVALRNSRESLGEVQFYSQQRLDRVDFVNRILEELNRRGWPHRSDIGWSEFDVEIHGNRWSAVQLVTVAEDLPPGRQFLRCRLRGQWSLQARAAFGLLTGLVTLAAGFFGTWWHWLPLLVLTLPAFAYFLWWQKRKLQSLVIVFLDELAKELNLAKVPMAGELQRAAQKEMKPVAAPKNSPFKAAEAQAPKDPNTHLPKRA
jgi:cellulose synthase/poly-beta-1,6-N-acetylglucosamine synthase-like glycosyltransferase